MTFKLNATICKAAFFVKFYAGDCQVMGGLAFSLR
jgi:hypothetical protein